MLKRTVSPCPDSIRWAAKMNSTPSHSRVMMSTRSLPSSCSLTATLTSCGRRITGASSGLSYEAPGNFDTHVLSLSYAAQNFSHASGWAAIASSTNTRTE